MRAIDLALHELIEFSDGSLNLKGRRLVLQDVHAFAQFRKDLLEMVGVEHARRILTRYGYYWGQEDAAAMNRIFKWESVEEWLKAGERLHTMQGVAKTVQNLLKWNPVSRTLAMEISWHNSMEAKGHLAEVGKSEHPICWTLTGYASGYASHCTGKKIYFVETKCIAKGDRICHAVGKDETSWGDEIKPYLSSFQIEGIHDKTVQLSRELRRKNRELAQQRKRLDELERRHRLPYIEVYSESFSRVLALANRVAHFDTSLLITGETGVGKEVLARYIHQQSTRAGGPFVAINCGALPETLLESELFGHKAGSFTGAIQDRIGYFEEAKNGTIFLDEIGDTTPAIQLKLLRVLQSKEIQRIGDSKTRKVNVRIITATNRDLKEAIRNDAFREDLYYRIAVVEIEIPPLRERKQDIVPLARYFVQQFSERMAIPALQLDSTCLDYLHTYPWPGNVRELENVIERAAVLSRSGRILPEHLPFRITHQNTVFQSEDELLNRTLEDVENDHIRRVMAKVDGNQTLAARILGINPSTLWRKLKRSKEKTDTTQS